jgi:hypothetical protein
MPSVTTKLERYVVLKRRASGLTVAYFQVPARLRPSGWAATIPLLTTRKPGDPDAEELATINRKAKELYARLDAERTGRKVKANERKLGTLVDVWKDSDDWPANRRTAAGYQQIIGRILAWSAQHGDPDPTTMTRDDVVKYLSIYNDRPPTKRATLRVLAMILERAIHKGWRVDNPARGIKVRVPKTKAAIWEQADVDAYVRTAREMNLSSIALIVLLEWEIGQRLTDVRGFRAGAEYDARAGVFSFRQSKTDEPVTLEVSPTLRSMLNAAADGQMFVFRHEGTGGAYSETLLSKTFARVRGRVAAAGGRSLLLKWLRHSCVVQLARAGCTVPEIRAITGHTMTSATAILDVYLPRDGGVARNAQRKRGIVE